MLTAHGNDRLITVHTPFLAISPSQNATLVCPLYDVQWIHNVRMIVAKIVWVWFFLEKKRKQNIVGEFAKMFETVFDIVAWPVVDRG